MRAALRLLAQVKPQSAQRFLEAGSPTGLTGLFTHPSPRSTLIYLYSSTLDKLKGVPESSVYRHSTEALTKHRLSIISAVKPDGFDAWQERIRKEVETHGDELKRYGMAVEHEHGGQKFFSFPMPQERDDRDEEWDGEDPTKPETLQAQMGNQEVGKEAAADTTWLKNYRFEAEPQLTIEQ
ncbi:hypothetical protein LTS18_003157 [Coniosporium uncinatum]|uniref:Uncharacterized protein n=1 Tax=Coniosporium uncinatum TaxID=93489 RepID=A0ACC3DCJ4_9PEZI|nr:hypothetical protein LTS18_003157 [Coniosporium uncinatum]